MFAKRLLSARLPTTRGIARLLIAGAVVLCALSCEAVAAPTPNKAGEGSSTRRLFWPGQLSLSPDLDPARASALAVRAVLTELDEAEQQRLLARWTPLGPSADGTPWTPRVDLLEVMERLHRHHGSRELALAAFFVGPQEVSRARAKVKLRRSKHTLNHVRKKLPRAERRELRYVPRAMKWATLYALSWPVDRRWRISSGFGERFHPLRGRLSRHYGVDIAVPVGTAVRAPAAGVVRKIRYGRANGRWIEVDHGAGVRTLYCHLSKVRVKRGQKVKKGDLIARSGATGRVTGPHLHYQVRLSGRFVDPLGVRVAPEAADEPFNLVDLETDGDSQAGMR